MPGIGEVLPAEPEVSNPARALSCHGHRTRVGLDGLKRRDPGDYLAVRLPRTGESHDPAPPHPALLAVAFGGFFVFSLKVAVVVALVLLVVGLFGGWSTRGRRTAM